MGMNPLANSRDPKSNRARTFSRMLDSFGFLTPLNTCSYPGRGLKRPLTPVLRLLGSDRFDRRPLRCKCDPAESRYQGDRLCPGHHRLSRCPACSPDCLVLRSSADYPRTETVDWARSTTRNLGDLCCPSYQIATQVNEGFNVLWRQILRCSSVQR